VGSRAEPQPLAHAYLFSKANFERSEALQVLDFNVQCVCCVVCVCVCARVCVYVTMRLLSSICEKTVWIAIMIYESGYGLSNNTAF